MGKLEERRPLETSRRRYEDNIEISTYKYVRINV